MVIVYRNANTCFVTMINGIQYEKQLDTIYLIWLYQDIDFSDLKCGRVDARLPWLMPIKALKLGVMNSAARTLTLTSRKVQLVHINQ